MKLEGSKRIVKDADEDEDEAEEEGSKRIVRTVWAVQVIDHDWAVDRPKQVDWHHLTEVTLTEVVAAVVVVVVAQKLLQEFLQRVVLRVQPH